MKKLLVCIPVFIFLSAVSQGKNPLIKISPLCLIDEISFPTVQAGIEFRLGKRIGFYNELGIKYRKSYYDNADTNYYSSRGFKLKTELRYYFTVERRSGEFYVATNGFYTKDYHNTQIGYYYQKDSTAFRLDNFGVKKTVWGLNILFGRHHYLSRKLLLDYYTGLGVRTRSLSSLNKEFNISRDEINGPIDLNANGIRNQIDAGYGKSTLTNFTLGIRLAYQL